MGLQFKPSTREDLSFYQLLLSNTVWCDLAGFSASDFDKEEKVIKYITPQSAEDMRLVLWDINRERRIGFCHFKKIKPHTTEIFGGLILEELNRGMGISSFVLAIDLYFKKYPQHKVVTKVMEANTNSLRMNRAIGFVATGDTFMNGFRYLQLEISPKQFYQNKFVKYFMEKFSYLQGNLT